MPNFDISKLTVQLAFDTSRVDHGIGILQNKFANFGRRMSALGASLTFATSVPLQLFVGASIKAFASLDDAVTRTLSRVSGATKETSREIRDMTIELSKRIPLAAKEIEEVFDQLTRSGGNLDMGKAITEQLSKFAVVMDNMDVREATDAAVKIMRGFGLQTDIVAVDFQTLTTISDRMVQVMENTGWQNKEVTEAFQKGAGAAQTYGADIDTLAASFVTLYAAQKEGPEAGTSFSLIIGSLANAYAMYNEKFKEIFGAENAKKWSTVDWMQRFRMAKDVFDKFSQAGRDSAAAALGIMPRQRRQLFPFLEQLSVGEDFIKKTKEMGVVNERFTKINDSLLSKLKEVWNAITGIGIALGNLLGPTIISVVGAFTSLIDSLIKIAYWFGDLPLGIGRVISLFSKLSLGITALGIIIAGPMLIFGGFFVRLVGWLVRSIPLVEKFVRLFMVGFGRNGAVAGGLASLASGGLSRMENNIALNLAARQKARQKAGIAPGIVDSALIGAAAASQRSRFALNMGKPSTLRGLFNAATFGLTGGATIGSLLKTMGTGLLSGIMGVLSSGTFWIATGLGVAATAAFDFAMKTRDAARTMEESWNKLHPSEIAEPGKLNRLLTTKEMEQVLVDSGIFTSPFKYLAKGTQMSDLEERLGRQNAGWVLPWGKSAEEIDRVRTKTNEMFDNMVKVFKAGAPTEIMQSMKDNLENYLTANEEFFFPEEFQSRISALGNFKKSGFKVLPPELAGDEEYDAEKKSRQAKGLYFKATTFGTQEEYKARVTGQQALVSYTGGLLAHARNTDQNTKQSAEHLKVIEHNTKNQTKPARLR